MERAEVYNYDRCQAVFDILDKHKKLEEGLGDHKVRDN